MLNQSSEFLGGGEPFVTSIDDGIPLVHSDMDFLDSTATEGELNKLHRTSSAPVIDSNIDVSNCTPAMKSIYMFISSMRSEKNEHILAFSSSTSVKSRLSLPLNNDVPKGIPKGLPTRLPSLNLFRPIQSDLLKHIETEIMPITHLSSGVLKNSPTFKPTGNKGEKHLLCSPAPSVVKKSLAIFLKHQPTFSKATFIVLDTQQNRKLFKTWTIMDDLTNYQSDPNNPIIVFTWSKTISEKDSIFKFRVGEHTMKIKGLINGTSVCILMDTGASGTAFIRR
jgi:hypothetical protein